MQKKLYNSKAFYNPYFFEAANSLGENATNVVYLFIYLFEVVINVVFLDRIHIEPYT